MISPYLGLRYDAIIKSDDLYIARVQEQDPMTKKWNTLHWVSCDKSIPPGQPGRWKRFLGTGAAPA